MYTSMIQISFIPQVSVVPGPGRALMGTGGVAVSKPSLSVSNITMLPNSGIAKFYPELRQQKILQTRVMEIWTTHLASFEFYHKEHIDMLN